MMKYRRIENGASLVLAIAVIYGLMHLAGITCPIKFLTGISCAGCGMTRACLALLRGDLHAAVYYHPLVFIMPTVLLLLMYRKKMNRTAKSVILYLTVLLFAGVYIWRITDPSNEVVVFNPESGLILQILNY